MKLNLPVNWAVHLKPNKTNEYLTDISHFLENEIIRGKIVYPPSNLIFESLQLTPLKKIKIVLIGQDPYHNEGQAHGLSFSVPRGIKLPPSLKNIYKELNQDTGIEIPKHGNLESWAKEGVLLLNCFLTVNKNEASSHKNSGWEKLTNYLIESISTEKENVVFLLWGKFAQSKEIFIDSKKHLVLKAAHPSPFSAYRGFFGCKHFSKANKYLIDNKLKPVNWTI